MLYTWQATLTERGAALAATCLLERLSGFRGRQLASYGYTGLPLVCACVLRGGGRYRGLCVREERKAYGSMRRIEGPADRAIPVVVVDDSMVSGTTVERAIAALEAEGFEVEGAVCLVDFPEHGAAHRLRGLGYAVEHVFDVFRDLELTPPPDPFALSVPRTFAAPAIPDGLHPATAARRVAERYLTAGKIPRPPTRLDQTYDGQGGVFVSLRERETDRRIARDGFWHFRASDADPCRDLVLATVEAIRSASAPLSVRDLRGLKIAVTFFGPLEKVAPGQLDFTRYGVVVRSATGSRAGGALPNTQYFLGEAEQYRHARAVNAEISEHEPHDLYRHTLTKWVEPKERWLPFGSPEDPSAWYRDPQVGHGIGRRAREVLAALGRGAEPRGAALPDDLVPASIYAVGVTLYRRGVVGCVLTFGDTLDACLVRAVRGALQDERFPAKGRTRPGGLAIAVSLLYEQEWLGPVAAEEAAAKMRPGLDALSVEHQGGGEIFLPAVTVYENWSKEETARELLRKAGDPAGACDWAIYPTVTWLERAGTVVPLRFGFPDRRDRPYDRARWRTDLALLADYVLRHRDPDGIPAFAYLPVQGTEEREGDLARRVHALFALDQAGERLGRADWRRAARAGLRRCLELRQAADEDGASADCILLIALAGRAPAALARRVAALVQADGRIAERPEARGVAADQEFLPGAALLALARYAAATGERWPLERVGESLRWYRRRFRLTHAWGMVGWHPQAWAALHRLTGDPEQAAFAFEIADWALPWQLETDGSFLSDLQPEGLSFHTAFLCEGVAAAGALALTLGDGERAQRYRRSCEEALRFTSRLILRDEDTFCLAEPRRAVGGVRGALFQSEVRIDFVSHAILAICAADECVVEPRTGA
jgi:AMMECR1 domain-containing protein/orotate phosphoribosyltransferase